MMTVSPSAKWAYVCTGMDMRLRSTVQNTAALKQTADRAVFVNIPQGSPVDCPLDFHLRVGNDAEYLLRIYFLHDDKKKRIVVGSLPRHLRVVTIK